MLLTLSNSPEKTVKYCQAVLESQGSVLLLGYTAVTPPVDALEIIIWKSGVPHIKYRFC